MGRFAPIVSWLPGYHLSWLGRDAVAGIAVAAVAIPTAMGYSSVAMVCQGTLVSAQWWTGNLPGGGHEFRPVVAMGSARRVATTVGLDTPGVYRVKCGLVL